MDLARAPRRAPLTARKKGPGYENGIASEKKSSPFKVVLSWKQCSCDVITGKVYCRAGDATDLNS
jgi:hypothetical protein